MNLAPGFLLSLRNGDQGRSFGEHKVHLRGLESRIRIGKITDRNETMLMHHAVTAARQETSLEMGEGKSDQGEEYELFR